jgi:hypothetical protein
MAPKKNEHLELENTDDFGFSFANEDELIETNTNHSSLQAEVDNLRNRIQSLDKMFRPLLINLSKDPDKAMIKWPNRKEMIDKQLKKLDSITKL